MEKLDLKKRSIQNSIDSHFNELKVFCEQKFIKDNNMIAMVYNLDADGLLKYLESDAIQYLPNFPYRYRRGITLWVKRPKTTDHFMHDTCNTGDIYLDAPVEDLYEKNPYKERLMQAGFLDSLSNHAVIVEKSDLFAITYTESTDQSMITDVTTIHPHCITHTLHEMFKLMLEWQWAYYELGSIEPMAAFCNDVLLYLGLDVRNVDSDPVVKSLMDLPDMYVAQFLQGNEVIKPSSVDPEEPLEFKLWASRKNMYDYKRDKYHRIYNVCLKIKILQKKLSSIQ